MARSSPGPYPHHTQSSLLAFSSGSAVVGECSVALAPPRVTMVLACVSLCCKFISLRSLLALVGIRQSLPVATSPGTVVRGTVAVFGNSVCAGARHGAGPAAAQGASADDITKCSTSRQSGLLQQMQPTTSCDAAAGALCHQQTRARPVESRYDTRLAASWRGGTVPSPAWPNAAIIILRLHSRRAHRLTCTSLVSTLVAQCAASRSPSNARTSASVASGDSTASRYAALSPECVKLPKP